MQMLFHHVTCQECPEYLHEFLDWTSRFEWIKDHYTHTGHTRFILGSKALIMDEAKVS
jgi:hypothetical protein